MTNKTYDTLKMVALIFAPVAVFIGSICKIWGVPHTVEITATLAAINVLLGAIVTAAKSGYEAGKDEALDEFNEKSSDGSVKEPEEDISFEDLSDGE